MDIPIEKLDQETQRALIYICERVGVKPSAALLALLEIVKFEENEIEQAANMAWAKKLRNTETPLP